MEKDFRDWHSLKTDLQNHRRRPFFAEREVWICSIGLNVGHEEDGKGNQFLRPVIIFKKVSADEFWGIPLTSGGGGGHFRYPFNFNGKTTTALLSQIGILDGKRLLRRSGIMPEKEFFEMADAVSVLIPKNDTPLGEEGCLGGPKSNCRHGIPLATKGEIPRGAEAHGTSIIAARDPQSSFL